MSTQPTQTAEFNAAEYIRKRNDQEALIRQNKVSEPAKPIEVKVEEPAVVEHPLSKGDRRRMNQLTRENGELRGELDTLKRLLAEGQLAPKQEKAATAEVARIENKLDSEPNRNDFPNEADYLKALASWAGRTAAQTANSEREQLDLIRQQAAAANEKFFKDIETIENWDDIKQKASELKLDGRPTLVGLFNTSRHLAPLIAYLVENPDEFKDLTKLPENSVEQHALFHQLEGEAKKEYSTRQKSAKKAEETKPEKKAPTAAELDARKALPSEAVVPKGGIAADGKVSMTLADGKTLNPAWKAQRNSEEGRRP